MTDAIVIAAIAAVAPTGAVILAWNQQRAATKRIEENTNGKLLALQAQVDGLKRLRAVDLRARSSGAHAPPRRTDAPRSDDG